MWRTFRLFYFAKTDNVAMHFLLAADEPAFL